MNKLKYILPVCLLVVIGCADLNELEPINSVPSSTAVSSEGSARASVNGMYSDMQDPTLVFDGFLGLPQYFTDECDFTGTFPTRLEFGNLNVFPANSTMGAVFSDLYQVINIANNVIELIPAVTQDGFEDVEKDDLVAQAKFIRAHCYLHLTTLWQDIPMPLTPTKEVGEVLEITATAQAAVYTQIMSDLMDAEASLAAETGPTQASKQAARALMSRVNLYQGNYAAAGSMAETVLGTGFDLTTVPYMEDQLYSLGFTSTDGNSLPFFYGTADLGGRYSIAPSATLVASYEAGDARRDMSVSADGTYCIKYPDWNAGNNGNGVDPVMFVRHAEMALIIAEAAAEAGDFGKASAWINQVRNRAGLGDVTLDASNYVDMLLQERFVEFAFEGPFRLLDLRRRGKALEVLGPIGYESCDDIWPLPQADVDRNTNLNQNDCCNC